MYAAYDARLIAHSMQQMVVVSRHDLCQAGCPLRRLVVGNQRMSCTFRCMLAHTACSTWRAGTVAARWHAQHPPAAVAAAAEGLDEAEPAGAAAALV